MQALEDKYGRCVEGKAGIEEYSDREPLSLNKKDAFKCVLLQACSDRPLIQNPLPHITSL